VEVDRRFVAESEVIFSEIFPPDEGTDPWFQKFGLAFAYTLMDGMALERLFPLDDQIPAEEFIGALKAISRLVTPQSQEEKV
jgi:hypothetical protein